MTSAQPEAAFGRPMREASEASSAKSLQSVAKSASGDVPPITRLCESVITLSFVRRQVDLYLSCSLTGGRQDQPVVAALVARLEAVGHRVLTEHLAAESAMAADGGLSPEAVFDRDTAWLR